MVNERRGGRRLPPGRPRDPAKGDSILSATIRLLEDVGYDGLSIEAVAQMAGVSRPTIYRRYQNKADLVIDVIGRAAAADWSRLEDVQSLHAGAGPLEEDVEKLLEALALSFESLASQGIVPGFLAELIANPDLAKRFFREHLYLAQQSVSEVLSAAAHRGEIPEQPVPEVILSTLIGTYIYHRFIIAQDFGPQERRTIARVIAQGLKTAA